MSQGMVTSVSCFFLIVSVDQSQIRFSKPVFYSQSWHHSPRISLLIILNYFSLVWSYHLSEQGTYILCRSSSAKVLLLVSYLLLYSFWASAGPLPTSFLGYSFHLSLVLALQLFVPPFFFPLICYPFLIVSIFINWDHLFIPCSC